MDKKIQERLYKLLGKNIKEYRIQSELTQDQLASKIDLTRTSVAKIERGKQHTPLHLLLTIAGALGTSLKALIPEESEYQSDAQVDEKTLKDVKKEDKPRFEQFYEEFLNNQKQ